MTPNERRKMFVAELETNYKKLLQYLEDEEDDAVEQMLNYLEKEYRKRQTDHLFFALFKCEKIADRYERTVETIRQFEAIEREAFSSTLALIDPKGRFKS